ncbi:RNA polymerase sigma factor [Chelativorans salis]|uniref:Transcriptional regulator n=1 Tax=Chelativorans salis TaxID=2978478 RepID=A0ABT2LN00_9HYPH|nr:sigma factor [Chelativorans sp. EGI FJ00035]MCT7375222.1 transcriptional regulator [Chelativorans sp. EGI FJ00035]
MRTEHYRRLLAVARRCVRRADGAEDLVQDALLEAVRHGRHDLAEARNMSWIAGVICNRARMNARGAVRARAREGAWHALQAETAVQGVPEKPMAILDGLPRALKAVAALALSGHNRREVAYLLNLSDTALRQRIAALKRHLASRGIEMPRDMPGLSLDLHYGRIRDALLPGLLRHGGMFASHDPDGHLFIVKRSQNP